MRRGDAGCWALAALGIPNNPRHATRATMAKAKERRATDHLIRANGIEGGWYAQALQRSFSIKRYDVTEPARLTALAASPVQAI
jgi:hypothetical protein